MKHLNVPMKTGHYNIFVVSELEIQKSLTKSCLTENYT